MATFTSQRRSFVQTPAISSLGLRFRNIKAGQTIEDISKSLFSDRLILTFFIAWSFSVILTFIYGLLYFKRLPLQIPLFYSRPIGEQQLASSEMIFLPVVGSFILGIISFLIASFQIKENKVLAYILSGAAPLVGILVMITTLNIINLVK